MTTNNVFFLQASLQELTISESDRGPARLTLYSNFPPTCQGATRHTNAPINCWVKFKIMSSEDIAMKQRLPSGDYPSNDKSSCIYVLHEKHWKPDEGLAYDKNSSLDIVAKVRCQTRNSY